MPFFFLCCCYIFRVSKVRTNTPKSTRSIDRGDAFKIAFFSRRKKKEIDFSLSLFQSAFIEKGENEGNKKAFFIPVSLSLSLRARVRFFRFINNKRKANRGGVWIIYLIPICFLYLFPNTSPQRSNRKKKGVSRFLPLPARPCSQRASVAPLFA